MNIAASITPHTLVVCIDKQERGIAIQTILSKAGYRVVLAVSLYDALKLIAQEMPHLVITEALLSDGSAGTIFDRLAQHPILHKTPIMVHVLKKTKDELTPIAGRNFAGVFLGPFEPRGFLAKVNAIVGDRVGVSPYFVDAKAHSIAQDMTVSIEANAVGRLGENLVTRSNAEIDAALNVLCIPQSSDLAPVQLRLATTLREGEEVFNLFPIHRMVGKGRKWVLALPEIKSASSGAGERKKAPHKVLFFEPSEQRFEEYRGILEGYDMELVHARTLDIATSLLRRDGDSFAACYLHELLNDAPATDWKSTYSKLPANRRPSVVVATSSSSLRMQGTMRFIKRPFAMSFLVETLQTAFERAGELAMLVGKSGGMQTAGLAVRFLVPAGLLGLDEAGGVMQLSFPLLKGSRLAIQHPLLMTAWEGNTTVQVVGSEPHGENTDIWHVRFEAVSVGSSRVKYWEKLTKYLPDTAVNDDASEQDAGDDAVKSA